MLRPFPHGCDRCDHRIAQARLGRRSARDRQSRLPGRSTGPPASVVSPPNLPYDRIDLVGPLGAAFGVPVTLINDARAGALGEHAHGAGKGCRDLVYVTISTGIGGGVIADGRLLSGRSGNAGEIGHIAIETRHGLVCGCGYPNHWEAYCSGRNLPRFYAVEKGIGDPAYSTAEAIFAAARADEPAARRFLETVAVLNARALSTLVVAYDPSGSCSTARWSGPRPTCSSARPWPGWRSSCPGPRS